MYPVILLQHMQEFAGIGHGFPFPVLSLPGLPKIWGTEGSFAIANRAMGGIARPACNRREEAATCQAQQAH